MKISIFVPSILFIILIFSACDHGKENPFINDVIKNLGVKGEACFDRQGQTYCIAKSSNKKRPIKVGEKFKASDKLMVCLNESNKLTKCQTITREDSDNCNDEDVCHCTGILSCAALANGFANCEGGSCGNCDEGDCCCTLTDVDVEIDFD